MSLFDQNLLSKAVEVQRRCYNFLKLAKGDRLNLSAGWAIGDFHPSANDETEKFKELVSANLLNFPEESRPVSASDEDIQEFANFFTSYLFCSFEMTDSYERLTQLSEPFDESLCWCELCTRLINAPNLKLKKVTKRDKAIANSLEAEALKNLCASEELSLSDEEFSKIMNDSNYSEQRALIAYGIELMRRCRGEFVDPSSLVLWRRFAWDKANVPKKNFVLTADSIEKAENELVSKISESVGK